MTPEQKRPPELNDEQREMAAFLLESCGLQDVADTQFEMMGEFGTVTYGLGRCAAHLMDRTPDEIYAMVMTKLEGQNARSAGE